MHIRTDGEKKYVILKYWQMFKSRGLAFYSFESDDSGLTGDDTLE